MSKPVEYIDRRTGEKVAESVMGDKALRFAYETLLGRTLWPVLFGSKFISAVMGRRYDSPKSKADIAKLAAIPGCQADEAEKPIAEYGSFNEFFTRRLKPGARPLGEGFVSPADGRLRLYLNASGDTAFPLKGATRRLREVFAPSSMSKAEVKSRSRTAEEGQRSEVKGQTAEFPSFQIKQSNNLKSNNFDIAVLRLAPVDYHRFHFPCDTKVVGEVRVVPGKYHSVNPIALVRYPDVYADNERQIVEGEASFGRYWMIDVGAFGVGTIVQTFGERREFRKGEERGYFKFGGSTVIVITAAGAVKWDADLVRNSAAGLETRVFCGERIGI